MAVGDVDVLVLEISDMEFEMILVGAKMASVTGVRLHQCLEP